MAWLEGMTRTNDTRNQAGCPHQNQTIADAVQDWECVLADIDGWTLSADLQNELQQLRARYIGVERTASA